MLVKDTAICIRVVDYSETSQIATFFARDSGKVGIIAKGSKRPRSAFDGPIELLSTGRIVFRPGRQGQLGLLAEFEQQEGFYGLREDFLALNSGLFGAELVGRLTGEYDPYPKLFDDYLGFLGDLRGCRRKDAILGLLVLFQLSLLREVGLQPVLGACANCGAEFDQRWNQVYFSSRANGLLCGDCEGGFVEKRRVSKSVGRSLANLKLLGQADEKVLREIEQVLVYHFTEILSKVPRMAKYVLQS